MKIPVKIKKSLNALKNRAIALRHLVHNEKCRRIFECPWGHDKCSGNLNLATACAWETARKIERFICLIKDCFSESQYNEAIYTVVKEIGVIRTILNYHAKGTRRWKIYYQIYNAYHSARKLDEYVTNRFKKIDDIL